MAARVRPLGPRAPSQNPFGVSRSSGWNSVFGSLGVEGLVFGVEVLGLGFRVLPAAFFKAGVARASVLVL